MRKLFMAILALAGAATLLLPMREANADEMQMIYRDGKGASRAARPARLRAQGTDPDTVWIGHVYQPSWDAGGKMSPPGGYGPYHVGRGNNLPTKDGVPASIGDNGCWDFDRFQAGESDSLFGWWPLARPYTSGSSTKADYRKSFFGFDYGNQVNYVINQGGPVDGNGNKRTFGVVGLWHRDGSTASGSGTALPAIPNTNPVALTWDGTYVGGAGSTASAWMGMKSHGDLNQVDEISLGGTGNPFTSALMQFQVQYPRLQVGPANAGGTDHNFPGYGSQMDQMLYRDIVMAADTDPLVISWNFSTNMSTGAIGGNAACGWFDKDPLSKSFTAPSTATLDGNFISRTAGNVVDSFMVYIGAPVEDDAVLLSNWDGISAKPPVFDKKRRWFSEVLQLNHACEQGNPCRILGKQLASYAGVNPPTPVSVDVAALYPTELQEILDADDVDGNGGVVRLVFRVKTNRNSDDEDGTFDSGTRGAAIVDNVMATGWAAADGNFESATSINNTAYYEGGDISSDIAIGSTTVTAGVDELSAQETFSDVAVGATVAGTGIPGGTTVVAVVDDTTLTLSAAATATSPDGGAALTFGAVGVSPASAWKSTGKPPSVYFHTDDIATIDFDDPCGGTEDPKRRCNMYGAVVNAGNHDQAGHKNGGDFNSNDQDRQRWFASPTINLCSSGPSNYNAMGINSDVANVTSDIVVFGSDWNGDYVNAISETGEFRSFGWQSYPATQVNGNKCWGEIIVTPSIFFNGAPPGCFEGSMPPEGAYANNQIVTSNANGIPDSLRVVIHRVKRCYSSGSLDDAHCGPTGFLRGSYFDNLAVGLVDGAPPPEIDIAIWYLFNDAFPTANRLAVPPAPLTPAQWDTAGAQIRNGANLAASTVIDLTRPNISGDTCVAVSSGDNVRLDMVFRIDPGPGNYTTFGDRASAIKMVPQAATPADGVTPGDGDFFGHYMKSAGEFSSGSHGGSWNKDVWNSARMDTAEFNLRPDPGTGGVWGSNKILSPGSWVTMYHEDDPKFSSLGIVKNVCYTIDTNLPAESGNVLCDGGAGTTKEYTKIIPDGLLVPGAHVQYFFRKSIIGDPSTVFKMGPDTNLVFPQPAEGNFDGHRWQQFGVLPDMWKDGPERIPAEYAHASARACMLYIDANDRRFDELIWVSIADSIGATAPSRFGAHNGWHARGDQDITVEVGTDPSIAVYAHGGQPGTIWDMYGIKASESSTTSSSLGPGAVAAGYQENKDDTRGPTGRMLRYYSILLILSGDLNFGTFGPYEDKTSDDLGLFTDFVSTDDPDGDTEKPRGVWAMGQHFIEGMGAAEPHYSWALGFFGAEVEFILSPTFSQGNYRFESGYTFDVAELFPQPPIQPVSDTNRYSVFNDCRTANDAMFTFGSGVDAGFYPATNGGLDTWTSSVYAPEDLAGSPPHEGVTLVEGFDIGTFGSLTSLTSAGRLAYMTKGLTNIFAAMCPAMALGAVNVGGENPSLVNFLALRSENPHRGGNAQLNFGITRKEKVELKVYDVTGRLVKVLANREFAAGEHTIFWDGSNEDGRLVPRGVYFYQLRTPTFVSQKKLAVLRH